MKLLDRLARISNIELTCR